MATIYMEQTETGSVEWLYDTSGATAATTQVSGSWSTYSLQQGSNTVSGAYWSAAASEFYGQCYVRCTNLTALGSTNIRFVSPNGTTNMAIGWSAGNYITALRNTTQIGISTTTRFAIDRWYYLQWKCIVADASGTGGTFVIKVDGVTEINIQPADNIDTRSDAAAGGDTCDRVNFRNGGGNACFFDDFIINDTTDTDNVSYPDNQGIEALIPNAAGDNTALSRGGADSGSNYGQVDERPTNDATDYVYDSVVDDYDIYNIPATQWTSVSATALALRCQKSDAGAGNIAHMLKIDTDADATADELDTGSDVALSTSWTYHTKFYNRQPDNAAATSWTAAKVNALQIGAKVR